MRLFKSRKTQLIENLNEVLNKTPIIIGEVLNVIDEYEKNNLATIDKLRREKIVDSNRISGALKQAINAHGPITKELIGSATKRILGNSLSNRKFSRISIRDIFIGLIIGIIISIIFML